MPELPEVDTLENICPGHTQNFLYPSNLCFWKQVYKSYPNSNFLLYVLYHWLLPNIWGNEFIFCFAIFLHQYVTSFSQWCVQDEAQQPFGTWIKIFVEPMAESWSQSACVICSMGQVSTVSSDHILAEKVSVNIEQRKYNSL